MSIAREEIFGPVLSVIPFSDEDEAVRIANDAEYGLAATVWTGDLKRAIRLTKALRAGTVGINGPLHPAGRHRPGAPDPGQRDRRRRRRDLRAGYRAYRRRPARADGAGDPDAPDRRPPRGRRR